MTPNHETPLASIAAFAGNREAHAKPSLVLVAVITVLMLCRPTAVGQEPKPGDTGLIAQFVKDNKPKKKKKPKPNKDAQTAPDNGKDDPVTGVIVDDVEYVYQGAVRSGEAVIVSVLATSKKGDRFPPKGAMTLLDDEGGKYEGTWNTGVGPGTTLRKDVPIKLTWRFGPIPLTGKSSASSPEIARFSRISIAATAASRGIEFRNVPTVVQKPEETVQPKGTPGRSPDAPLVGPKPAVAGAPEALAGQPRKALIEWINKLPPERRPKSLAINQITDQNRLARLASEDKDKMARETATRTLTDQKLLAKVAGESPDSDVRSVAVRRITGEDQPSLLKLIETTEHFDIRAIAIKAVKDPALQARFNRVAYTPSLAPEWWGGTLAWKALESKDPQVRYRGVGGNNDITLLLKVAREDPDEYVAQVATERLIKLRESGNSGIEDTMFEKIALGAKTFTARQKAVGLVSKQSVLAKAAQDREDRVRSAAAERLDDQGLLARLARDKEPNVRFATSNRLEDTAILQNLADSDPDALVRWAAGRQLDALRNKQK